MILVHDPLVRWPTCQGTFWGPSTRALPGSGPSFDRAGGGKKFKAALTRLPGRGGLAVCNPLSDSLSCSRAIPKTVKVADFRICVPPCCDCLPERLVAFLAPRHPLEREQCGDV